ncbi:MAG: peroxidase [Phycisphaerae bacterium]
MQPLYLSDVERADGGPHGRAIRQLAEAGLPVPSIMRLTAFKPSWTGHLMRLTHALMRGPSALPAGTRELIAALVSRRNACVY